MTTKLELCKSAQGDILMRLLLAVLIGVLLSLAPSRVYANAPNVSSGNSLSDPTGTYTAGSSTDETQFVLNIDESSIGAFLQVDILVGDYVLLSERRYATLGIDSLQFFQKETGRLRRLIEVDQQKPGIVQVRISQNDKIKLGINLSEFVSLTHERSLAKESRSPARRPHRVGIDTNNNWGQCEENCQFLYDECLQNCDPQGQGCENCQQQFENCLASCPDCDDWVEVSRTRIGRRYSGSANIAGVQYCLFKEYYLVEQTNPDGCYADRTVCETDQDTIFYGFGNDHPSEALCCNNDPGSEFYCGGTTGCS